MASSAQSLQGPPAPWHLSHPSGADDQPLPVSALQLPTLLHPHAHPPHNLHAQHKHRDTPLLPLLLHSGSTICGAARALPRTSTPFLGRQQITGKEKDGEGTLHQNSARSVHRLSTARAHRSIPLCRISNPTSRQVTFSKRRNGLLKKAYELSVLCDAEVGTIIFSAAGSLSEFASSSTSMPKLIERYKKFSNTASTQEKFFHNVEFWRRQVFLLRDQLFHQKNFNSYMLGENLSSLNLNDIQIIEQKIEVAINKVQAKKAQLIQAKEQEFQTRKGRLLEENDVLKCKLFEATNLPDLKEKMLTKTYAQKASWLGDDFMKSSIHDSSPLTDEANCPSTASNLINQHINNHLKLKLELELFPSKPAG